MSGEKGGVAGQTREREGEKKTHEREERKR